jgi:hypothetical protein
MQDVRVLLGMSRGGRVKKKKKRSERYETDKKLHGLKKNKNPFCKGCIEIKTCWKGRAAAIALCEDYRE